MNPILPGEGEPLVSTLNQCLPLELLRTTTFRSGDVPPTHRPA